MNKPKDIIIERVVQKFLNRSEVGFKKYGVTLKDDYQPLGKWLTHIQEELMDALLYIEAAKRCLQNEIEESMLKQAKRFDDDVSNINVYEEKIL